LPVSNFCEDARAYIDCVGTAALGCPGERSSPSVAHGRNSSLHSQYVVDSPETNAIRETAPLLAGLTAAVAASALICQLPRSVSLSWRALVGSAAACVFAVALAGAAGALVSGLAISAGSSVRGLVLRIACVAAWFAPLSLLLQERSLAGLALAAALAAAAALLLDAEPRIREPAELLQASPGLLAEQVFVALEARSLFSELLSAFGIVVCAEGAAVAQLARHEVIAAGLAATSAALFMHRLAARGLSQDSQLKIRQSMHSRPVATLALALLATMAGLLPFLRGGGSGFSWAETAWDHTGSFHETSVASASGGNASREKPLESGAGESGGYSGIVLWPKHQELVKLVAPPARAPGRSAFRAKDELTIPFNGVYLVFKPPDSRPPLKSHQAQGSPDEFNIYSKDGRPLRLEAHQNLATLVDLSCCRAIQVAIRDADRYPGSVALELIVRNTTLPGKPKDSLGTIPVASTRPWTLHGETPAVSEVLTFDIPPQLTLSQFDEVTVVFQLSPSRSNFGAKIGIEKFTLVPRGLPWQLH